MSWFPVFKISGESPDELLRKKLSTELLLFRPFIKKLF